ncbi:Alpha/beta-hydrolase [Pleurostoma richardsiae]|uniref:Alpha/beta-hydrolase n=1 Tax=Pleurostoma richardsiae TaxID=41990 RepID=A0AA38R127_9PEZI|nr:Alpha/beta-hydrolase [Pleurostoma richardsiae]
MTMLQLPDGRLLSYELTFPTEPQRPTVLLSNSLSAQYHFWDDVVSALHASGLRVLRYDYPGHCASTAPADLASTTFASLADDVFRLLTSPHVISCFAGRNQPGELVPFLHAWIGVSMGAALGVYFAIAHPGLIKNLVLCDTVLCSPGNAGQPDPFGARVEAARKDGSMAPTVQQTMERWFGGEWIASNPEQAERLRELMLTTTLDGYETCIAALQSPTFDLRPLAPKVATGIEHALIVVGEKDADLPVKMRQLQEGIERGFREAERTSETVSFVVIANAGHLCFIDNLEDYKKAVIPFVKGLELS